MKVKIISTGYAFPDRVLTNADPGSRGFKMVK